MVLFRLLIILLCALLALYYLCVVLHILGVITLSKTAETNDPKILIPLYYFFKK